MTSASVTLDQKTVSDIRSETAGTAAPRRWSRQVAADIVGLLDVTAIILGATLPVIIYSTFGGLEANWILTIQSGIAAAVVSYLLMKSWGMYDTSRMHCFPEHPARIFAALAIALIGVIGIGLPYAIREAHLWVWYAAWCSASYTLLLANRGLARIVLQRLTEAGRFDQRVAVYGAGNIARRVHDQLQTDADGIHFVGVYDDRAESGRVNTEGLLVTGGLSDLIEAGRNENVDKIIVALPQAAESRMSMIARKLEQLPVSVHIVTHIASDLVEQSDTHRVSSVGSVGLLDVKKKPLSDWEPFLKRGEDLVLGSLLMLITAPLFPLIALAIKLESKGPVFFVQRRRGLNKKTIPVLKFRTMTVTQDCADVTQATRGDARITRVGSILRRLSLDELPQLINVLRGEMSLVGPRPHAIVHDDQFGSELEAYANRHQVKPGITGLAQVSGYRGELSEDNSISRRIEHDITYIQNWSLSLDMQILWRTLWVVIKGKNAY